MDPNTQMLPVLPDDATQPIYAENETVMVGWPEEIQQMLINASETPWQPEEAK